MNELEADCFQTMEQITVGSLARSGLFAVWELGYDFDFHTLLTNASSFSSRLKIAAHRPTSHHLLVGPTRSARLGFL
jgi:hypothetical protein